MTAAPSRPPLTNEWAEQSRLQVRDFKRSKRPEVAEFEETPGSLFLRSVLKLIRIFVLNSLEKFVYVMIMNTRKVVNIKPRNHLLAEICLSLNHTNIITTDSAPVFAIWLYKWSNSPAASLSESEISKLLLYRARKTCAFQTVPEYF